MQKTQLGCGGIFLLAASMSATAYADTEDPSALGGKASIFYSQNGYNKDDYRSVRSLNWSATANYKISENYSGYLTTGGYRAYEDKTGDFFTDSVLGVSRSSLFSFGETGKVGASLQFTIPTSETSKKEDLNTAARLGLSVSGKTAGFDLSIAPRYRKNFHEYKTTVNGKVLTEHVVSVVSSVGYGLGDAYLSGSIIGGTSWTYSSVRRDWTYVGQLSASYKFTDSLSGALSASNSGVYFDAEQGTLGNIDLFDEKSATYTATLTYSF
ncbi:hypothetical protein GCE9029_00599 [Grimontia celer]|uniref:Outer membrane protein beta-barrel domain-containing protein n=1 Tax=Grimontia celer TaxID=1796497 RepID=A0A128ETV7_9GAMM|nr:hypothetical protein [Grimontia celer]CZF78068.1 hypothetical protein GCE9029_00599 [Grimontia celer]